MLTEKVGEVRVESGNGEERGRDLVCTVKQVKAMGRRHGCTGAANGDTDRGLVAEMTRSRVFVVGKSSWCFLLCLSAMLDNVFCILCDRLCYRHDVAAA